MQMKWLAYFQDAQKQHALHSHVEQPALDYGEIVYQSSQFLDRRWLVANFKEEFNVFVEYNARPKCFDRLLAATFSSKERAVSFAAEMFLICCGRLKRKNRRSLCSAYTMPFTPHHDA
ncbi:MAG TPA: hypothetical protein VLG38_00285 [Gammaproteobacteria bacterium]|nr:hypothetical protein [Gammaproteobacteria bacterium]